MRGSLLDCRWLLRVACCVLYVVCLGSLCALCVACCVPCARRLLLVESWLSVVMFVLRSLFVFSCCRCFVCYVLDVLVCCVLFVMRCVLGCRLVTFSV